MRGIWYEFISPNNIHMVCLGKYNWEQIDEYGWNKQSPNYDENSIQKLTMMIGQPMDSSANYRLSYVLNTKILDIDGVKMTCELHKLDDLVDNIVKASGFEMMPLFSHTPEGFDKHLRLQKIKRLLGNE